MNESVSLKPLSVILTGALLAFAAGSALATPVQCPVALWDDMSALFEVGEPLDLLKKVEADGGIVLRQKGGISVQSAEGAGTSSGAKLSVKEDFASATAGSIVELRFPAADQPKLQALTDGVGLWVKTTPYVYLSFRYRDAAGRTFTIPAHRQKTAEWEYAGTTLRSVILWEGKGGGSIQLPAQLTGIQLSTVKGGYGVDFSAELRDVQWIRRPDDNQPQRLGIDVEQPPIGLVYRPGQTVKARFAAPGNDGDVRWRLVEYGGTVVAEGAGKSSVEVVRVLDQVGHYRFLVELFEKGKRTDYRDLSVAALEADQPVHARIGICGHWARPYYNLNTLDLLPLIGLNRVREGVQWDQVAVSPNVMRVPDLMGKFLLECRKRGIRGMTIINGKGKHFGGGFPQTPEAIESFLAYGETMIKETDGVFDRFELWNEWSNATGMDTKVFNPTPENYVRLAKQVIPPLRKVAPTSEMVGLGGENPYRFEHEITGMLEAGGGRLFDSISLHPYRQPFPPEIAHTPTSEPLDETMKKFLALSGKHGGPDKIQITEMGYPTFRLNWGVSEVEHARLMVRTLAMLHSVPEVDEVYWYALRDEPEIPLRLGAPNSISFSQHGYGLFRDVPGLYAPKPAAVALATYVRQTAGGTFGPVQREANGLHRVEVFEPDGTKRCSILWTVNQPVEIKLAGKEQGMVDLMGRTRTVKGSVLRVTQDAVYLK